jgi:predicted secreted protein
MMLKKTCLLALTGLFIVISITACSSDSQPSPSQEPEITYRISQVDVSYSGSGKGIDITAVGSSLTATLWSHHSAGSEWELTGISNPAVVEQTGYQHVVPDEGMSCEKTTGGPGKEIWTFSAIGKGESNIILEYRTKREGKTIETLTIVVVVK